MQEIVPTCPICGGEVVRKEVEKIVKGGNNVAILKVKAGVCLKCGERIYTKETHEDIQQVRKELKRGIPKGFKRVGNAYRYKVTARTFIVIRYFGRFFTSF